MNLKKTVPILAVMLALVFSLAPQAQAQSAITTTTLSSAISTTRQTVIAVTSATGFTASTNTQEYDLLVDRELMKITGVSGTNITVQRGVGQSLVAPHVSGARVYAGAAASSSNAAAGAALVTGGPFVQYAPTGTCTRNTIGTLPVINIGGLKTSGAPQMFNCLNGFWRPQTFPGEQDDLPLILTSNIPIGSVAYGSIGTNTTDVAGQMWITSIYVPQTALLTGVQVLQGGTAGTDSVTAQIFDAGGTSLANSAAAGVALNGSANTFLSVPFTSKTLITGPALYYVAVVGNGTAAGAIQTVPTATFKNIVSGTQSGTFGTFTGITTPPTTFTAGNAPVVALYY